MLKKSSLALGWKLSRAKDRMRPQRWLTDSCLVLSRVYWKRQEQKSRALGLAHMSRARRRCNTSAPWQDGKPRGKELLVLPWDLILAQGEAVSGSRALEYSSWLKWSGSGKRSSGRS